MEATRAAKTTSPLTPRARVFGAVALVLACVAWVVAAPSVAAFAVAVLAAAVTVWVLASLDETFTIRGTEIQHRNWWRSVTIDSANLANIERPDAESSVRELLMVDAAGQSISVPLSRLNDNDEFAQALAALLESTPVRAPKREQDTSVRAKHVSNVVDVAA